MRINYNATAVVSNKALNRNDDALSRSLERLSSGLKINAAKDNPAGLAIAHRMDSQIRGFGVASDSTRDGTSVVESADGAIGEMSSILQRINELAVQAGSDTSTDDDRMLINQEVIQLKEELKRIAEDTEFNGQPLLDGTWDLKGYTDDTTVKVDYYTSEVPTGEYELDFASLINVDGTANPAALTYEGSAISELTATLNTAGDKVIFRGPGDYEIRVGFDKDHLPSGSVKMEMTGIGSMKIQTGVNEKQEMAMQIPKISLDTMGVEDMDLSTFDGAQAAIAASKEGMDFVNQIRGKLGAYQNRLEHNDTSVGISSESMTTAYSRIMDVDMAEEMTEFTTRQVLVQAGTSMLSQANERPQSVLQLLQ